MQGWKLPGDRRGENKVFIERINIPMQRDFIAIIL